MKHRLVSAEQIGTFLQERFAKLLGVDPSEVVVDAPIVTFGIDSMETVEITGELEEWLAIRISPTLVFETPTISALAARIFDEQAVQRQDSLGVM